MTVTNRSHAGGAKPTALSGPMTNAATSFSVTAGGGTGWPDGSLGSFVVCVDQELAGEEKILCSARAVDTFTVATTGRGYDGTVASAHANLAVISHVFSAVEADELNDHLTDTSRDDHTQYLTAARGDALFLTQAEGDALYAPIRTGVFIGTRAYRNGAQDITPSGGFRVIPLDAESYDSGSLHSNSSNPSRLTLPTTGFYQVNAAVRFADGAGTYRAVGIFLNGNSVAEVWVAATSGVVQSVPVSDVVQATAGDYLELFAYQDTGGSLALYPGVDQTFLSCALVGT